MDDDLHCEHVFRLLISACFDHETFWIIVRAVVTIVIEAVGMCMLPGR